jgi:hypothetical protein
VNNYIMVNRKGERWRNENQSTPPHVGWHQFTLFDDSICDYIYAPTWVIFDQTVIDAGQLGPDPTASNARGMYAPTLPKELGRYDGWSADNQVEIEKGWVKHGDTLEALIADMGEQWMDLATLQAQIDEWNAICAAGVDHQFARPAENLLPINNPPYYAYPIYPGGCSTLGGPKKNEHAQILDVNDEPIPRLYGAGCFGNFQAHTYGITGGNNAENMVWGRIGARHACALDPWDAQTSA